MLDLLFDIYHNVESAKELWDSLESKYMAEDASSKKFLVSNFNNYEMVDSRPVMKQFNELLRILGQYTQMDESIFVSSVIDKLPPSWKDFKHSLKHGKDDLSLVQLEEGGKNKNNKQNKGKKRGFKGNNGDSYFNKKPKLECWKCGKTGYFKRDCRSGNKKNNANAGGSGKGSKDQCQDQGQNLVHVWNRFVKYFVSLISEAFYVQVDAIAWWIDSGAKTYVCKDRCWFKTYEPVEDEFVLYMGDDHFAPVPGKGSVVLEFSSIKSITLFNVLYVPKHRHVHYKRMLEILKDDLIPVIDENPKNVLLVWGCRAVVRVSDPKKKTLGKKGIDCIFVGYAKHSKEYRFYVIEPNAFVSINTVIESRDAIFDENRFSSIPRPNDIIPNSDESQRDDHLNDVPSEIPKLRRGKRARKAKSYGSDFHYSQSSDPSNGCQNSLFNDDLEEEVYMKQPEGFVMPSNEHKVCKLVKSLYGLKQAPKQWHQKFDEVVLTSDFLLNQSDKCVYSKFDDSGKGVIICLYADDMLIFGTDQNQVDKTKKFLASKFSMKDMGETNVILGIKIKRENKGIVITQSYYIKKILKKFNCEDWFPVSTPMDPVGKLMPNTSKHVDQIEYSRAIGCLMYAMTSTRPDIAYAVGRLSRFTSNPSRRHWHSITRVFNYLKGTMNYGLSYVGYPSVLEAYLDASWINHVEDSSSTSGWVFLLGGALAAAGKEAEWLRNLIHEIPIWLKPIALISIHYDSAATLAKAYSQIYNGKSRHLGNDDLLETIESSYLDRIREESHRRKNSHRLAVVPLLLVHVEESHRRQNSRRLAVVPPLLVHVVCVDLTPNMRLAGGPLSVQCCSDAWAARQSGCQLCKQGHWFSFENKTRGRSKKCFKEVTSSLKGWKKKFFLIDRRAIPDAMSWRHIDTDVRDDLPTNYNEGNADPLAEHIILLYPHLGICYTYVN
ncbi:zinc finger, CCHC-type containing protein [Tanacetum coccineum]